jgi:hypothetical protein
VVLRNVIKAVDRDVRELGRAAFHEEPEPARRELRGR